MNNENDTRKEIETSLRKAADQKENSRYGRNLELLRLTGGLERVTLHVTRRERERLVSLCGAGTIEGILEAFISDLARSDRSIWEQCRSEAQNWLCAHRQGERAALALDAKQENGTDEGE